ncbi:MAG: CHAP domain-containing protein [Aerococcus sp.]|nr:CHAP domain-containing protein [Aerococcus sp.]
MGMENQLIKQAEQLLGTTTGDSKHRALVQDYNQKRPLPRGYAVTLTDDWCDIFVTVMGDRAQLTTQIGRECSVKVHVDWFKNQGIWLGKATPKRGDIVTFDWEQNGWPDHIGIVCEVHQGMIDTIEGNTALGVARRQYQMNQAVIYGYARPRYSRGDIATVVEEVLAGKWGNGEDRRHRLAKAGYDYSIVQAAVNQAMMQATFTVSTATTHWATGEKMADWVKGQTFLVAETRQYQGRRQYLIMRANVPLGWIDAHLGQYHSGMHKIGG